MLDPRRERRNVDREAASVHARGHYRTLHSARVGRSRNQIEETAWSVQAAPGERFPVVDFAVRFAPARPLCLLLPDVIPAALIIILEVSIGQLIPRS